MHLSRTLAACALFAAAAFAQDTVTLNNGDTITGTIKTMADGKVIVTSPIVGDITIPLADIKNLVTKERVALETVNGDTLQRRIAGIENDSLRLDGDLPSLPVDSLVAINPPPVEPPKWTGSIALNALWMDGNTRRRTVGAMGEAVRKSEADRISVDAFWDYSEDRQSGTGWNLTQRRAGAGLKYDYFLSERWYALATTRVLGDTFADLSLRYTAGLGIGYTVIDTDETSLLTEVGISYVDENYRSATPSTNYVAARVARGRWRQRP